MRILVVNAGSSSLKLSLVGDREELVQARRLDTPGGQLDAGELYGALDGQLSDADAVGHRVVHGGQRFRDAVLVDDQVRRELGELTDLAPLHQLRSLAAMDEVSKALPRLPAIACFDTAFHHTLSPAARTYALPAAWRTRWGIVRFGFHGLSHAWVARRAAQLLDEDPSGLRIVSCHLGAGASLCAIDGGRSRDTTMGFSPLEGLVMATRSGTIDPAIPLWLIEHAGLGAAQVAEELEHRSGLLALGGSADMRELLRAELAGDRDAQLALDVYAHRLRGAIAAMSASLGGLDALAFTGGVGERSAEIRSRAAGGLRFLGVQLDDGRNRASQGDGEIGATGSDVKLLVITAREDLEIARQARALLE